MIERNVMRSPGTIRADVIVLWERLAVELSGIIGQGGFDTLYARSVHVARARHPWLDEGADPGFDKLGAGLEAQEPAAVGEASIALLIIFTDTLIQLIGAPLTTAILRSAWGRDTADTAAKGIQQ
ncbi:hypothetical protein JOD97_000882 [Duganella sp. 1411]|uniref:hypothetical protein n=1 Tax=Duganella sp. 1411 TaxID=2806572 RepID=UPI001AE517C2|nr:hypothetical protein [Duganella sp. 1411]MBP1202868.1 hypothetical protein [Duganella sp. 1411]